MQKAFFNKKNKRINKSDWDGNGFIREYSSSGSREMSYKDGKLHGRAVLYFPGKKKAINTDLNFCNGVKEGRETKYYLNGEVYTTTEYKEGLKEHKKTFDIDGNIVASAEFSNGRLCGEGDEFVFFRNGKLHRICHYKNEYIHGEQKIFYDGHIYCKFTTFAGSFHGIAYVYHTKRKKTKSFKIDKISLFFNCIRVFFLENPTEGEVKEIMKINSEMPKIYYKDGEAVLEMPPNQLVINLLSEDKYKLSARMKKQLRKTERFDTGVPAPTDEKSIIFHESASNINYNALGVNKNLLHS